MLQGIVREDILLDGGMGRQDSEVNVVYHKRRMGQAFETSNSCRSKTENGHRVDIHNKGVPGHRQKESQLIRTYRDRFDDRMPVT